MAKVMNIFDFRDADLPEDLFQIQVRQQDMDAEMGLVAQQFGLREEAELTDEMIQSLDIEDISCVNDYRYYVKLELAEAELDVNMEILSTMVEEQLAGRSDVQIDPAEVDREYEESLSYLEEQMGADLEEYLIESYQGENLAEAKVNMHRQMEQNIKVMALAAELARRDGITYHQADYDQYIRSMVSENVTEDDLRAAFSYDTYVGEMAWDHLNDMVQEYFEPFFHVKVVE